MSLQSSTRPYRISLFRGDSHTVEVTVKKKNPSNPTGPLLLVDITGASAVLTVKTRANDTTALIARAGTIPNPPGTDGLFSFEFAPADTASLKPGPYVYDVQVTDALSKVYTVLKDVFEVKEDVTNDGDGPPTPTPTPDPNPASYAKVFTVLLPAQADLVSVHAAHAASGISPFPSPASPDKPRNLQVFMDSGWDGGDVRVDGTDQFDVAVFEVFATGSNVTRVGSKVFKTVTSVTKTLVGTGATASVGIGNSLGLAGHLLAGSVDAMLFVNNLAEPGTLDSTYNSFTPTGTLPDGLTSYALIVNVTDNP